MFGEFRHDDAGQQARTGVTALDGFLMENEKLAKALADFLAESALERTTSQAHHV